MAPAGLGGDTVTHPVGSASPPGSEVDFDQFLNDFADDNEPTGDAPDDESVPPPREPMGIIGHWFLTRLDVITGILTVFHSLTSQRTTYERASRNLQTLVNHARVAKGLKN